MAVYLLLAYCDIDIICMYTDETEIKIYIYITNPELDGQKLGFTPRTNLIDTEAYRACSKLA